MKKQKRFIAIMNSESFEWIALGDTEAEAKEAIRKAWNKRDAYKRERLTLEELEDWYGIGIYELSAGQCEWH